jgi:hypothetical protein
VATFKYLGTTVTSQNDVYDEIRSRLNSENGSNKSAQNLCLPISYQKDRRLKYKKKTVTLPVVLYGCEAWSLTLSEEHRLRVFEKRVLRIFGPKREEDGSWRKLHKDELHNLYPSPNIVTSLNQGG